MSQTSLLKFQIGPVQDFIAAARSTRDLWSGSYLLSWLVAEGIKKLQEQGGKLIFPISDGQPLLTVHLDPNAEGILIPNLPNIFIAKIEGDAKSVAEKVKSAIQDEWDKIAASVWKEAHELGILADKEKTLEDKKTTFTLAVNKHLSISWQATAIENENYAEAYRNNGWHLDAVRQTREFDAWGGGVIRTGIEKDSLTGKEEAIGGGKTQNDKDFSTCVAQRYKHLFKHNDHFGAITLIKRVWHLTYLKDKKKLKTDSDEFNIRSIPAIAARKNEHDDNRDRSETTGGDKYIAAIAFDGDSIGAWVNGDHSPNATDLREHHQNFSRYLSNFALGKVRKIVEGTEAEQKTGTWLGQLIYAGGDDVVALVPSDAAIEIAKKLRKAFCDSTENTPAEKGKPDASAGIAIAHIHAPLQDLIREAQKAEKHAKNEVGRPAFSVTLMKRSGEISHWGSKWEGGGIDLYHQIAKLMNDKKLSAKFPHRLIELLEAYITSNKGLSKLDDAIENIELIKEIIHKEFAHAASRQGSKLAATERIELEKALNIYLKGVVSALAEPQELLTSLIGLCTTVAFANRTQSETSTNAEKQTLATA